MAISVLRLSLITATSAVFSAGAALAQVSDSNVRAVNLARNWAVNNNGGLSVYRPAACMFNTSDGGGSCLIQNNSQGFTFRFMAGGANWNFTFDLGCWCSERSDSIVSTVPESGGTSSFDSKEVFSCFNSFSDSTRCDRSTWSSRSS